MTSLHASLVLVFPPEPRECEEKLWLILPADLTTGEIAWPRVGRRHPIVCMDVGVRDSINEQSNRIGKAGNRRSATLRRPGD